MLLDSQQVFPLDLVGARILELSIDLEVPSTGHVVLALQCSKNAVKAIPPLDDGVDVVKCGVWSAHAMEDGRSREPCD